MRSTLSISSEVNADLAQTKCHSVRVYTLKLFSDPDVRTLDQPEVGNLDPPEVTDGSRPVPQRATRELPSSSNPFHTFAKVKFNTQVFGWECLVCVGLLQRQEKISHAQ